MNNDQSDLSKRLNEAKRELELARAHVDNATNKLLGCGLLVSVSVIIVLVLPIAIILWKWALQ